MSEPKTLALDPSEWKALLLDNLARAHQSVVASENVTPEGLAMFNGHIERVKGIAAAWYASQRKVDSAAAAPAPKAENGAGQVKRRGGWPKGRPRKNHQEAGMAQ